MATIIRNFMYNSILTVSGYVFPIITYPYVSRVLGVDGIGICNFVDGIINYFILFSALGINLVGIREVAKHKEDSRKLSECFMSIFLFNVLTTILMEIILLIMVVSVDALQPYRNFLLIGAMKLAANLFLVEWFYKGMENFRFITIRAIIVKLLYVVGVFLFVNSKDDCQTYYLMTTLLFMVNAFINWHVLRRFVSVSFKRTGIMTYAKPIVLMGCYSLLTSMYTSFNVVYLGFIAGDTEVGYYVTATKMYTLVIALFSAFTSVMLPHMSVIAGKGDTSVFIRSMRKSSMILFRYAIPATAFLVIFSPEIVRIISGPGYDPAVLPMRVIMPLLLIIGYEQILIIQTLMPMRQDKAVMTNSIIGSVVGLTLNLALVPRLGCLGSAIVWVAAEVGVACSAQLFVRETLSWGFPLGQFLSEALRATPLILSIVAVAVLVPDTGRFVGFGGCALVLGIYYMWQTKSLAKELCPLKQNDKIL